MSSHLHDSHVADNYYTFVFDRIISKCDVFIYFLQLLAFSLEHPFAMDARVIVTVLLITLFSCTIADENPDSYLDTVSTIKVIGIVLFLLLFFSHRSLGGTVIAPNLIQL